MRKAIAALLTVLAALVAAPSASADMDTVQISSDNGFLPVALPGRAIVWETVGGMRAARAFGGGTGSISELSDGQPNFPDAAATPSGNVLVVDREDVPGTFDTLISTGRLSPDGTSGISTFPDPGGADPDAPVVAFTGDSTAAVAFDARDDRRRSFVKLALTDATGSVLRTVELGSGFLPQIDAGRRGLSAVAWDNGDAFLFTTANSRGSAPAPTKVPAGDREYLNGVAWGAAQRPVALVGDAGTGATLRAVRFGGKKPETTRLAKAKRISDAVCAPDRAGDIWFSWTERDGDGLAVKARRMAPSGKLGPTISVSRRGMLAELPSLVGRAGSGAFVTWRTEGKKGQSIRFAQLTKGGIKGARTVTTQDYVGSSTVALDRNNALVAWYERPGVFAAEIGR